MKAGKGWRHGVRFRPDRRRRRPGGNDGRPAVRTGRCNVAVLEKHADFFRDFRGDTVHPSTLELLRELGLIDEFLKRPHDEVRTLTARVANEMITIADLSHLPVESRFVAMMPQWEFLDFLAQEARHYPTFALRMEAEAVDLVFEDAGSPAFGSRTAKK